MLNTFSRKINLTKKIVINIFIISIIFLPVASNAAFYDIEYGPDSKGMADYSDEDAEKENKNIVEEKNSSGEEKTIKNEVIKKEEKDENEAKEENELKAENAIKDEEKGQTVEEENSIEKANADDSNIQIGKTENKEIYYVLGTIIAIILIGVIIKKNGAGKKK